MCLACQVISFGTLGIETDGGGLLGMAYSVGDALTSGHGS